ncbi:simple sugar transport system permease protein [Metamycoplasma subdolum]|uniref:Simple sugar transport system permease protein n=1 Tax=Metamycoplasma subdolum TaxID=92407 RepID=A0A3M0A284_9BACT|nr:ABC transporter permease [Metamycoplasma subdolum]RMA78554.1 simple sugar transport system permease protein [Metamycoplasma subdolum]WPB50486.1 ABC transporter permease [Metamycoplasma subdolum]
MDFAIGQIQFYAIILCLGALCGVFCERVGIINIGIEGMISMGSLGYALGGALIYKIDKTLSGSGFQLILLLFGMIFALGFSCLHGMATIKLKSDHTISGVALNLLAVGICTLILKNKSIAEPQGFLRFNVNEMVLGSKWWQEFISLKFFLFIAIIIAAWIALNKTKWGLRFRSIGENPQAADVAGINVNSYKWQGIIIAGLIAGVAGSIYSQEFRNSFKGSIQGLGFLALAVMIMGHWRVEIIFICSIFFSIFFYLGVLADGVGFSELTQKWFKKDLGDYGTLIRTFPYLITLVSLMAFSKMAPGPAASGVNYDKSKR